MQQRKRNRPLQIPSPAPMLVTRSAGPCRKLLAAGVVFLSLLLVSNVGKTPLGAQEQPSDAAAVSREYQVKAAYLYQFGRYVQWPESAFAGPQSPFVIGVLKEDPTVLDLGQLVEAKKIQDRPIEIRQFSLSSSFSPCHTLFLSAAVQPKMQAEIIQRLLGKNVLLVGETDEFIQNGGVINFVIEDNKIRLYIARKAAERQGLRISSKLLQIAHVVD